MTKNKNLPLILIVLDGWGISKASNGNAVTQARTPVMDSLLKKYPNTLLCAHGNCVGLPDGQVGNSEAGHTNIGAGRIIDQEVVRINKSIKEGLFYKKAAFVEAVEHIEKNKGKLHLMGLLSNGMSPHSDPSHLLALMKFAKDKKIKDVCLHLFTDGRDSHRYASLKLVEDLQKQFTNNEKICTIMGRFYAMDRKKKWERTEMAYNALALNDAKVATDALSAITESYNRGESDEFIQPYTILENKKYTPRISDNDSIIFFNLRSDRGRQLTKAFVQEEFEKMNPGAFRRKRVLKNLRFVPMTDFGPDLGNLLVAYPSVDIQQTLPMQLADLKQLYIAETEKYAHVTYFFNGGYSGKVDSEETFMVPSPDVNSYDQTPAMSSEKLASKIVSEVKKNGYDFTVLNFAAPDMIGHTGNLQAAIKCCEEVDKCLGKVVDAYLKAGGTAIVTADHGNIEQMINQQTGEMLTEHTTSPVPFILVNNKAKNIGLHNHGVLGDIAPTILDLLDRKQPEEMTGKSLINKK